MLMPLLAVIVIAVIWSIYWWLAITMTKDRLDGERQRLASHGIALSCAAEGWGGYPFRFEFDCRTPEVSVDPETAASFQRLQLVALAYKPWHVLALADGPTLVRTSREPGRLFVHDRITASLRIEGADRLSASVEVPHLRSDGFGSWAAGLAHVRTAADDAFDLAVTIKGLRIDTAADTDLVIDDGSLLGQLDPSQGLTIENIDLRRGTVAYRGSGIVSLDRARRLEGRIATETNDLPGLMDILEPHLILNDQQRGNLRLLLGLFGTSARFDLTAQDGAFHVGPLKVADLLPLY